ncbi:MAG: hypothetical protein CO141_01900 [Candidatus Moranbacteria bacterium CG_4_9_14_3_um_filter_42_9]|nr:MAG: hypothetical protein CO141_01900 [Candidatus Moranbacteria bacterium CG_4_9_14_3_um_filter_42_9]
MKKLKLKLILVWLIAMAFFWAAPAPSQAFSLLRIFSNGTSVTRFFQSIRVMKPWQCGDTLTYCGDSYATVQMTSTYGSQCWLQENLRNTTKPDCATAITSYCHASGCASPWGRLYTWTTAMNGATTATGCGAKIQGICPSGWHIPSDYTSCATDDFPALGTNGGALKKVNTSSGVPWAEPNTGATNASNWTGYPAGYWGSGFNSRGYNGFFWSSAENDGSDAWNRLLYYYNAGWVRYYYNKSYGFSVRCVKD